jgi:hypothetical protein
VVVALLLWSSGCASNSGWSIGDERSCAPKSAPRVCVRGEPDYGHVVEFADVEVLPGECAVAGEKARGGLLRVRSRDRERHERGRWLGTRRGKATIVEVDEDGKLDAERHSCKLGPISTDP